MVRRWFFQSLHGDLTAGQRKGPDQLGLRRPLLTAHSSAENLERVMARRLPVGPGECALADQECAYVRPRREAMAPDAGRARDDGEAHGFMGGDVDDAGGGAGRAEETQSGDGGQGERHCGDCTDVEKPDSGHGRVSFCGG